MDLIGNAHRNTLPLNNKFWVTSCKDGSKKSNGEVTRQVMEYCNVKFYMAFAYCTIVFALYNTSFLTKCAADNIKWKKKENCRENQSQMSNMTTAFRKKNWNLYNIVRFFFNFVCLLHKDLLYYVYCRGLQVTVST